MSANQSDSFPIATIYQAVIVGAGQILETDHAVMDALVAANPQLRIIAADGGADTLASWGYTPHTIIGDFDSIQRRTATQTQDDQVQTVVLPAHKDETDMHEAVTLAWQHGAYRIALLGALGNRLDHTLANIQLLSYLAEHGGNGTLIQGHSAVTVLAQGSLQFPLWTAGERHMVSVFAHTNEASPVTLQGLAYEGTVDLVNTHGHGVSNEFVPGRAARIEVGSGLLTVTWEFEHTTPLPYAAFTPEWHSAIAPDAEAFGSITTEVSQYYAK